LISGVCFRKETLQTRGELEEKEGKGVEGKRREESQRRRERRE
jgi:hypothetical protein